MRAILFWPMVILATGIVFWTSVGPRMLILWELTLADYQKANEVLQLDRQRTTLNKIHKTLINNEALRESLVEKIYQIPHEKNMVPVSQALKQEAITLVGR